MRISPPIYGLWDFKKIRAISSMDMKHVSIAGTWTEISFIHNPPYLYLIHYIFQ